MTLAGNEAANQKSFCKRLKRFAISSNVQDVRRDVPFYLTLKPDLATYIKEFTTPNRAPGATWSEATKHRAPHKPILLLAVLDLVHRGMITSPFIDVTGDLVELNELFNLYWRHIIPLGQTSSIAFPFSRLDREPFRERVPQPGKTITPAIINVTSSV